MTSFDPKTISFEKVQTLIRGFEEGTLKQDEWHHSEHLLITLWYLTYEDPLLAIVKIKAGILKYNLLYKVPQGNGRGYHETITLFFIKLVQNFIARSEKLPWETLAKQLTETFPNHMETLKSHFSSEVLRSDLARLQWVEPDLKQLPTRRLDQKPLNY